MVLDLPTRYKLHPLDCYHTETMDPAKKPEWYRRHPQSRSTEVSSSYRTRRVASSYSSRMMDSNLGDADVFQLQTEVDGAVHCREVDQCPENIGSYRDSALAQGLGLYHTGVHNNLWHHPGFYDPDPAESPVPDSSAGEDSDSDSDVIFLVSTTKDTLLCGSLSRDTISPIVAPLSPAALSLDEGRGCFLLPQPLSSPSPDSTDSEESSDSSVATAMSHRRPVVLLHSLPSVYGNPISTAPDDVSSDDSDVIEVPVTNEKRNSPTFTDGMPCSKTEAGFQYKSDSAQPRRLRRSARIRDSSPFISFHQSSHHNAERQTRNTRVGFYKDCSDSGDVTDYGARLSSSEEEPPLLPALAERVERVERVSADSDESECDPVPQPVDEGSSESPQGRLGNGQQSSHIPSQVTNKRKKPRPACKGKVLRTNGNAHPITPAKQPPRSSPGTKGPVNKSAPKRRRKKCAQSGPSSMFSPREPEIALNFAKYKKEKSDSKSDSFCPFIHVDHRQCTVVNYQDEVSAARSNRSAHKQAGAPPPSGFVPRTSCFRLGRLGSESKCQPAQACCLCGVATVAMGLGDLHGPYYPATATVLEGTAERNHRAPSPDDRGRNEERVEEKLQGFVDGKGGADEDCLPTGADKDSSPAGDRSVAASTEEPLADAGRCPAPVALHTNERWIHEDCGIWSAGVFLVKGKLYGLEEAAKLAQETVCSICHEMGATMGCFQKGCLMNYHYRCAIQSGCALNEDNFSMRCPQHKNPPLRSLNRNYNR